MSSRNVLPISSKASAILEIIWIILKDLYGSSTEITPFRFIDDVLEEEVEDHERALEAGGLQDVVAVLGLARRVGARPQKQLRGL